MLDAVFNNKQDQLKDIVKEVNKIGKINDAKDDALIVSSDDEGRPLQFLKKLKLAGVIESVSIDKDEKLDIKLNENFCGTIDFCGDLTSYKRECMTMAEVLGDADRTGKFKIERPFGNEIIIDVFEELLNKIKKHNGDKNKEKQIQFVAVPGNHEFLGFQGKEDNLAVVGQYEKFNIDPIDGMKVLKTKLRGAKVIADIQKYFLEQVRSNGEEKNIVDDDYGDSIGNIAEKITTLDTESDNIKSLIEDIDKEDTEKINKDIEILQKNIEETNLRNINDLNLSKLNVLQWHKSHLLSKIVFFHNGKKFRTLHSFSLFASPKALAEYGTYYYLNPEEITAYNQQEHFGTNLNQNIVNINGVNSKSFPEKTVFKNNKIATFVGHEGRRSLDRPIEKVFCVDITRDKQHMLFIVDEESKIQGYDLDTGNELEGECGKMETYDVEKEKKQLTQIQSVFRGSKARKDIREQAYKAYKDIIKNVIEGGNLTEVRTNNLTEARTNNLTEARTNNLTEARTNNYQFNVIEGGNLTEARTNNDQFANYYLVKALKEYNKKNNNIIQRQGWLDKAFSFGENNAKKRRINQLAKIMNNEFTKNMTPEEKRKFKKKDKHKRQMKDITFDNLSDISNMRSSGCCSAPATK